MFPTMGMKKQQNKRYADEKNATYLLFNKFKTYEEILIDIAF